MFKRKEITTGIFVLVILAFGVFSTWFTWNLTVRRLSDEALEQARLVARSINLKRLESLKGNSDDLNSPDYLRIKDQLSQIRQAHRTCRFLYLMGHKSDGTVFFFLDSQLQDSKDYAPPGLVYEEVSDEYLYTFNTGKQNIVGPIKDRWGTLITCLIPIYAQKNKQLITVLGMDIEAKDWNKKIISQCLFPITLTTLIITLTIMVFIISRNRQMLKIQYDEKKKIAADLQQSLQHVKKIQGLLPICASCKKIRDDEGYWNQIESYLEEHSEVKFSHGICEECADNLYGDKSWYQKRKMKLRNKA